MRATTRLQTSTTGAPIADFPAITSPTVSSAARHGNCRSEKAAHGGPAIESSTRLSEAGRRRIIYEARTGSPFGVIENNAAAIYPTAATVRSDVVAPYRENPNWRGNVLSENFFDPSSFAAPAQYTFGNAGRTVAIGPGAIVSDLSVLKNIAVKEGQRLQLRAEALNFLNHANFALPNQSRGVANFGRISALANGNQARIIQLGLHYKF